MPVLVKLNQARAMFHALGLKKTGRNEFAGYDYFELADFLVPALEICNAVNLCGVVSFGTELASLTLTDLEDGTVSVVTSPMSTAKLKACHEVQNLGAVQTYLRRYLWVAALEIVEHDALNKTQGQGEKKPLRHSPVPDVDLPADRVAYVSAIVADILACFADGQEAEGIRLWYAVETFGDNEERIHAWKQLAAHSKIRSVIRANKPA